MQNKICVYAICKNESQFVDRWCKSMKEADCVVVLDTGSSDDTVERLRVQGVTVVSKEIKPWRFDVARNEALKLVPEDCNILVSTDLDEYFEPGWAAPLREQWIDGQHKRAVYTYYLSDSNGLPCKKILYNKIHSKGWYWKYPVHELLLKESDNTENLDNNEELFIENSVILYHYPDMSKSRGNYIDLLELRAQENPEDYFGLYYLAKEYEAVNLDKAFEVSMRGIQVADNEFYKFIFMVNLGTICEKKFDYGNALNCYINALQLNGEYRFVYLFAAKLLFNIVKDYERAFQLLYNGLKYSYRHDYWFDRNDGWDSDYYDLMSLSAYYCGRKAESLIFALVASSKDESDERLKGNINSILNAITDKEITDYEE